MPRKSRKEFGKYIVADPLVCHGALTFRGTRVFVDAVLEQVADGKDWDRIVESWNGSVSREAIAEAIKLCAKGADSSYQATAWACSLIRGRHDHLRRKHR